MSLYTQAAAAINTHREAKQAELDRAAADARAEHIAALRRDLRRDEDTAEAAILNLVAETIQVGRESDGYPKYLLPNDTKNVIDAAIESELLLRDAAGVNLGAIRMRADLSDAASSHKLHWADLTAWNAAKDYREAQRTIL